MECYLHKLKKKSGSDFCLWHASTSLLLLPDHFLRAKCKKFPVKEAYFWKAQACSAWYINLQKAGGKFPSSTVLKTSLVKLKESAFMCSRCLCISLSVSSLHPAPGFGWQSWKEKSVGSEMDDMSNSLAPTQSSMELYPQSQKFTPSYFLPQCPSTSWTPCPCHILKGFPTNYS